MDLQFDHLIGDCIEIKGALEVLVHFVTIRLDIFKYCHWFVILDSSISKMSREILGLEDKLFSRAQKF